MNPNITYVTRLIMLLILIGICFTVPSYAQTMTAAPAKEPDSNRRNKSQSENGYWVAFIGSKEMNPQYVKVNVSYHLSNIFTGPPNEVINKDAVIAYVKSVLGNDGRDISVFGYNSRSEAQKYIDEIIESNRQFTRFDGFLSIPDMPSKSIPVEEAVNTSDWVEDGPAGVGKTIYIRNNSQKKSIKLTELNVYECVNVGVGGCGVSTNVATILPGQSVAVRLIPPSSLNNKSGVSFLYKYWAEYVK